MKRILHTIVCSIILFTSSTRGFSQVVVTSSDSLICSVTCTTLTATVSGYSSTSSGVIADDAFSAVIPIGFTFSFYGTAYTQCLLGSNGVVSFNLGNAGAYNSWPISSTLINAGASAGDIRNVIAGPWCDIYLAAGGTIDYAVGGTAPYRKFVANFCSDQMFSCSPQWLTSQVILYETTNIAEVHIAHHTFCTSWNNGHAEVGVVNATSTAATTAPGRDFPSVWNATNEAWRFTPTGAGTSYSVTAIPFAPVPLISSAIYWYNATTGAYISSGHSITVCPATATTYKAGALGCADTSFGYYTVTPSSTLPPIAGRDTICSNTTTTLSDAVTGGLWSSDNTNVATISGTGVVYGVSTGTSTISYSTGSCATSVVVTVSILPPITGDNTVCAGSTLPLSNAVAGGTWSSNNTAIATVSPTGIVYGITPGVALISYSAGCTTSASITVTPSIGAGGITGPPDVCVGATITLSDTVSGGVWSISNGNATLSGNSVTGISQGTDTVSYTVTSVSCGTAVATAIISVDLSPVAGIITGDSTICAGANITLSDPATGGVWGSSSSAVASVSGAGVVHAVAAGTAIIGYAVTNACGTATTTHNITVFPVPPISPIIGPDSACPDAVFVLSDATPGGHWSNTNPTVLSINDSGKVSAFVPGAATIIYTIGPNAGGCSSSVNFQVTISFQGNFVVNSIVKPVSCYGDHDGSIHLGITGTQAYQYLWNNGVNGPVITGLPPGYDTVSIKAEVTQCLEVLVYHITQPDSLELTATTKNDTCDAGKGSASVDVTGGTPPYTYHWSDNKTGKDNTGLITGTYSVTVTDSNGCTKSITATVHQDTCNAIIIHNVITPNGDGKNDMWEIEGIQNYPTNTVQVFDKWGDMVFEKTNYSNDWSGKGKKGELPDGTYYYLIKLNTTNLKGGKNVWTGYLLIKR